MLTIFALLTIVISHHLYSADPAYTCSVLDYQTDDDIISEGGTLCKDKRGMTLQGLYRKFEFTVSDGTVTYKPTVKIRLKDGSGVIDITAACKPQAPVAAKLTTNSSVPLSSTQMEVGDQQGDKNPNKPLEGFIKLIEFKKTPHIFALLERTQLDTWLLPTYGAEQSIIKDYVILSLPVNTNELFYRFKIGTVADNDHGDELRNAVRICLTDSKRPMGGAYMLKSPTRSSRVIQAYFENIIEELPSTLDELPASFIIEKFINNKN